MTETESSAVVHQQLVLDAVLGVVEEIDSGPVEDGGQEIGIDPGADHGCVRERVPDPS